MHLPVSETSITDPLSYSSFLMQLYTLRKYINMYTERICETNITMYINAYKRVNGHAILTNMFRIHNILVIRRLHYATKILEYLKRTFSVLIENMPIQIASF